ncbi:MAG: YitT family protein, partial [Bacteroidia bacterium]
MTKKQFSSNDNSPESNESKVEFLHLLKDLSLITLGIFSAGFGLKSFLLPNSFIDGGVTGISLLINKVSGFSLAILIVLINIPFVILGFTQIGKSFAIKSILAILGLAIVLVTVNYPVITSDRILIGVFGGVFLGAGIGLSIRGGAVLDGTEVLAIYLSKRTSLTIGDIILGLNIVIFSVA